MWMMAVAPLKALTQAIARNPWSSLQDGLLIAMAMVVALLLALEYDLFSFIEELSEPQRKISLAEAIFLTALLAVLIVIFVIRRLHEERRDVARQISTKKQLVQLRKQASRDSLTDLANRDAMLSALDAITSPSSLGGRHAFFLLDLNDFKRVNDLHGHVLGDRVLQVIAQRFRGITRPSDLRARLRGDEFALLFTSPSVTMASITSAGASTIGCSLTEAEAPREAGAISLDTCKAWAPREC